MRFSFRNPETLRNLVFGVEDSLVSTIGLVSGIAAAGVERHTIIVTSIVLILVEAFSMAVGSLVSENSAQELIARKEVSYRRAYGDASVMFFSYVVAGFLVVFPYFIVPVTSAFVASILVALAALFLLGFWAAHIARVPRLRKGFSTAFVGGLAIAIGTIVGILFR